MSKSFSILLLIAVGVLIVIGLGFFIKPTPAALPVPQKQDQTYTNAEFGVSFTYPQNYNVQERTEEFEGSPLLVVILTDKASEVPDMSEGPTAISLIAAHNASSTSLQEWVQQKSISNFYLSPDKALASTTLLGEPALLYRYSGLYENDVVAVSHAGKVYLFSVSWADENAPIRHDFEHVVESVELQ